MTTASQSIQAEASQLVTVRILGAVEAGDWAALARLTERLGELAARGLYHQSLERARTMAGFAMAAHQETEPR